MLSHLLLHLPPFLDISIGISVSSGSVKRLVHPPVERVGEAEQYDGPGGHEAEDCGGGEGDLVVGVCRRCGCGGEGR